MFTTPARTRTRSEAQTPLTPSIVSGIDQISLETTNPFISRPVKRDALQRQAKSGVVRKGGIESRLEVVTKDYIPPKPQVKRSKSTPAAVCSAIYQLSIFLTAAARIGATALSRTETTPTLPLYLPLLNRCHSTKRARHRTQPGWQLPLAFL